MAAIGQNGAAAGERRVLIRVGPAIAGRAKDLDAVLRASQRLCWGSAARGYLGGACTIGAAAPRISSLVPPRGG
jgi:hypothetical protein